MSYPQTYGLSSVTYGNPTMTGFVVQATTISSKCGVVAEIFNELGERVHSRYDDLTYEISLDMIVNGGAIPLPGAELTFNSIKYEIQTVEVKTSDKDFTKVGVKAKNSAGITLA